MHKGTEFFALTKESNEKELKLYFNAVLKLAESDNEFPINLDEVWMLVYNRRDYATEALKKDFIEGIDYIITSVKTEVGSNKNDYYISLSCMEFFIARKVRAVFEVYRKVFHKTTEIAKVVHTPSTSVYSLEDKMKAIELSCKMLRSNKATKARMINSVIAPMGLPTFDYIESKGQKRAAKDLLPNGISSFKFNKAMEKHGFIEYVERTSKTRGIEKYPVITQKGLKYGENEESPEHPGKTQPHYYVDKFNELMKLVGLCDDKSLFNEN